MNIPIQDPRPVILLDIDGVMNTTSSCLRHRSGEVFATEALLALNGLLRRTGARVVVTSTRRRAGLAAMRELFCRNRIKEAATLLIDTTPILATTDVDDWREDEIEAWLHAQQFRGAYVIIDDKPLAAPFCLRQVRTDPDVGLTMDLARQAAVLISN